MVKYIDIEIDEFNSPSDIFKGILKSTLNQDDDEFERTKEILVRNTNSIINKFEEKESFLLFGDVQSGKTNNLIYLVSKLFEQEKVDIVFYLTGLTNDLLNQNQSRFFDTFEKMGPKFQVYRNKNIDAHTISIGNPKVIISSLKTKHRLSQMNDVIEMSSRNKKFLIIDDEADEASLSPSSRGLFSNLKSRNNVKMVSITATPFANLYKNQNFYDYFQVLRTAKAYCGIESFDKNIIVEENQFIAINKAFVEWLYSTTTLNMNNSQLLINIFSKNDMQDSVYDYVYNKMLKSLKKYSVFESNIRRAYPEYENSIDKMFEMVKKINIPNVKISNGISDDEVTNEGFEVIIGGVKLSRGITYKNLMTEVMLNMGDKINPGTLIQRARWFGYRENIDFMRIIVNGSIRDALEEGKVLIQATKDYSLADGRYKDIFNSLELERLDI